MLLSEPRDKSEMHSLHNYTYVIMQLKNAFSWYKFVVIRESIPFMANSVTHSSRTSQGNHAQGGLTELQRPRTSQTPVTARFPDTRGRSPGPLPAHPPPGRPWWEHWPKKHWPRSDQIENFTVSLLPTNRCLSSSDILDFHNTLSLYQMLLSILPYFGKRMLVTTVTFLVKEQNVCIIFTDIDGISWCLF